MVCNSAPATEVDHVEGGAVSLDSLRSLCRVCHELKPRGDIPADLTRDGGGEVDSGAETLELKALWQAAIFTGFPLNETIE